MSKRPSILIGVPVYEGWDFVGETLESIGRQEFTDYRVLISVDGSDKRSHAVCERYTRDPRFELVLQTRRLNWAGNVNWLIGQLHEDFFCYWQQDDLCDPAYLRMLFEHAVEHPEASAVYSDLEYFGDKERFVEYPSVTGFALQRVLHQIERNDPMPHRGLIRRDAMRAAAPVTQPGPWTVTLAREGELHRVPRRLYFKRVWEGSISARLHDAAPAELRARTLDWGLGNLRAALPLVPRSDFTRLLAFIADQLVNHRPCRGYHYVARKFGPEEPLRLVADFLGEARARYGAFAFAEFMAAGEDESLLARHKTSFPDDAIETLMIEAVLRDLPHSRPPKESSEQMDVANSPSIRSGVG